MADFNNESIFVSKLVPLSVRSNLPLVFKPGSKVHILLVRSNPSLSLQQIARYLKPYLKNQIGFKIYKQERIISKYIRQLMSNFSYLQKFRLNPKYDWAALKRFQIIMEDKTPFFEHLVKFSPLNKYWKIYSELNIFDDRKTIIIIAHDISQSPSLYTIKYILSLYYRAMKGEKIADYILLLLMSDKMKWIILKTEDGEENTPRAVRILLRLLTKYLKEDSINNIEEVINRRIDEDEEKEEIKIEKTKKDEVNLLGKTIKVVKNAIIKPEEEKEDIENKIPSLARLALSNKEEQLKIIAKAVKSKPNVLVKHISNYVINRIKTNNQAPLASNDKDKNINEKQIKSIISNLVVPREDKKEIQEYHTKYVPTAKITKNLQNLFFPKPVIDVIDHNYNIWKNSSDLLTILLTKLANTLNMKIIFNKKIPYIKKNLNNIIISGEELFYTLIDGNYNYNFSFILPSVENGIINIFGQDYNILPQLIPNTIQSTKSNIVRIHSLHDLIVITKKNKYIELKLAGTILTPAILFCIMRSWKELTERYNIKYRLVDVPEKNKISIKLKENLYLILDNYDSLNEAGKIALASIFSSTKINTIYDKLSGEPLTREWFISLVEVINAKYHDIFLVRLEVFLDKITTDNLQQMGYPDNLPDLVMYISEALVKDPNTFVKAENDLTTFRLRTYEQVVHIAYNIFFEEIIVYLKSKLKYGFIRGLKIDRFSVINRLIRGNPCIINSEYANPLEMYALSNRISYKGYNGISDEAVSLSLRNIHPTYKGVIDLVDTPEGKNIGVVQTAANALTVITNAGLLNFYKEKDVLKAGMFGPVISMIPFSRQNEPTRLLISASQLKQAIAVADNQPPAIMSGYEMVFPSIITDKHIKRSPCDGKIKEITENTVELECEKGEIVVVPYSNFSGKSGIGVNTYIRMEPIVKVGQEVKNKQPLVTNKYFFDGLLYSYGTNVLAGLMDYYGYTYEDGIVVSPELIDRLETEHTTIYKFYLTEEDFLYKIYKLKGDNVEAGDYLISATAKKLQDYIESSIFNAEVVTSQEGFKGISQYNGVIEDIKIFTSNIDNIDISEREKLKPYIFLSDEPVYYKSRVLKGTYIEITVRHKSKLSIGDKLVTRHANKGVISFIEDKMPLLKDGRKLDIIFSPQAIINRLITGLLYEMQLSKISYYFGNLLLKERGNFEKIIDNLRLLQEFDKDKDNEYQRLFLNELEFNKRLQSLVYNIVKKTKLFPIIIPPFYEPKPKEIAKISHLLNLPFKDEVTLKDGNKINIPTGYVYLLKLEHMSNIKIGGRSVGGYDVKTGQPFSGYRKGGGIKFGEYDTMNMISWDVENLLTEIHINNLSLKRKLYADIIDKGKASLSDYSTSELIKHDRNIVFNTLEVFLKGILITP